jgi:hypothetical protein
MQKLCCDEECGEITINYAKWENQGLSMIWTSASHYVPAMSCITLQTAPLVHVQKQSCCHTTPQKTKKVFKFQAICIQHISIFKCFDSKQATPFPIKLSATHKRPSVTSKDAINYWSVQEKKILHLQKNFPSSVLKLN